MSTLSISAIQNTQIIMLRVNSVGTTSACDPASLVYMRSVAAPRGGLGETRPPPPISHRDQFSNSSKSDEKEWGRGWGTVGFINVSRSSKYTCRVTKNCAFKFLYDLENSHHYYPENPGNCISGIPDFKIFPGEHAP